MKLRIKYYRDALPETGRQGIIALRPDAWDDFGWKTTFQVTAYVRNKRLYLGRVKILFGNSTVSRDYLDELIRSEGVERDNGLAFSPSVQYLSLASEIEYYERVAVALPTGRLKSEFYSQMHDVAFLDRYEPDSPSLRLKSSPGFERSLLRSISERTALVEAMGTLPTSRSAAQPTRSFSLEVPIDDDLAPHVAQLDFSPDHMPSRINVLVGANGTGKTQMLRALSERLIQFEPSEDLPAFVRRTSVHPTPLINQVIAISFSPYDAFHRNGDEALSLAYRYCGFYNAAGTFDLHNLEAQSVQALNDIIVSDATSFDPRPPNRLKSLVQVLRDAVDFDLLAVEQLETESIMLICKNDGRPIVQRLPEAFEHYRPVLLRGKSMLHLSAGQNIFLHLLINVIAALRRGSLFLIDEPELYLHPSLEVSFLRMLKRLLSAYDGVAVIATHSAYITREVPSHRVTVLRRAEDGSIICRNPDFETFGADLGRISNYVFDNVLQDLPFRQWLREQRRGKHGHGAFIDELRQGATPELAMELRDAGIE